jgi:hypothetical protein
MVPDDQIRPCRDDLLREALLEVGQRSVVAAPVRENDAQVDTVPEAANFLRDPLMRRYGM